jgi:hypothetical protein
MDVGWQRRCQRRPRLGPGLLLLCALVRCYGRRQWCGQKLPRAFFFTPLFDKNTQHILCKSQSKRPHKLWKRQLTSATGCARRRVSSGCRSCASRKEVRSAAGTMVTVPRAEWSSPSLGPRPLPPVAWRCSTNSSTPLASDATPLARSVSIASDPSA